MNKINIDLLSYTLHCRGIRSYTNEQKNVYLNLSSAPGSQESLSKNVMREFPGSPVVRTQCFHCQGPGSIPDRGTKILQAVQCGQKRKKKKKKKKVMNSCKVRYQKA